MKLSPVFVFFLFAQLLSAQIQDKVDFVHAQVAIEPTPSENRINGSVTYQFDVIEDGVFNLNSPTYTVLFIVSKLILF